MSRSGQVGFGSLLILGGAGLVGAQVAKKAAAHLHPERIIIASLYRREVEEVLSDLRQEHPEIRFEGYYGNIFLRGRPIPVSEDVKTPSPREQKDDPKVRGELFEDTYRDFETGYQESLLARLILSTRPDAVVDCINTATGISYQDEFLASDVVARGFSEIKEASSVDTTKLGAFGNDLEKLLVSIAIPQLILHVRVLYRAMTEVGSRIYLKVGTTGTGGMGLNLPYTHGEDKPSPTLMSKNAVAFAQTGLLFLMARTAGAPVVKELKPAAMIGYKDIDFVVARGPQWRRRDDVLRLESGQPYLIYDAQNEALGATLDTTPVPERFTTRNDEAGEPEALRVACVNTGENGFFTKGEFEVITAVDQMEFITPEEIAEVAVLELRGSNTGRDVISAVDSSILGPTYKAGMIRHVAVEELERLEAETGVPSVALGQLGPPQLAKYLYEAHLFRANFGTIEKVLGSPGRRGPSAEELSELFFFYLKENRIRDTITSIGIPILQPDGKQIWRGPVIKIPAYNPKAHQLPLDPAAIDRYAQKGWVDLRPAHMQWWLGLFERMTASTGSAKRSSERITREAYLSKEIRIGQIVAWAMNNLLDPPGHRIK
ncbi:MAG: hypothetical protein IPK72_14330 [Candidatus Eisenbacteria bacterium]|nr:hypothetical protein [Candidatus Eisenbacteria bacterium]